MTIRNFSIRMLGLLFMSTLLIYCSSDDDNTNDDPMDDQAGDDSDDGPTAEEILAADRQTSLDILTGGDLITWKIATAIFETAAGEQIDISDNFNIRDDEFTFSGSDLEWRPGNDVNTDAASAAQTQADYYRGPQTSEVAFEENSGTILTALGGRFTVTIEEDGAVGAVLRPEAKASGDLILELSPKTADDYASAPASGLVFEFETNLLAPGYMGDTNGGLIGSYSNNSLFIAHRDDTQGTSEGNPERILKYNLTDGTQTESLFYQSDFVTKRLNIIDNQIVAFGGQFVNTYDLSLGGGSQSTFSHEIGLTRFGFAVQDDEAFVVGGDLFTTPPPNADIRRYNYLTNELEVLASLPVPLYHAAAEILNDKLYIFGGRQAFSSDDAESTCYIYDLSSGSTSNFNLPEAAYNTFAARVENLIYVAYETRTEAGEPGAFDDDRGINFGVYNTLDNSFTVVSDNLDDADEPSTIHAITIFNGRLYVIYGNTVDDGDTVSVYSAPIQ